MKRYNPKDIEPKWQKIWDETNVYTANLKSDKPKYIGMSMFNYPSGAGIHIGHAMNYTISDVKARFKRQQGYESYHPVGWDSFGLPAENYAIKAGISPQESMATIIPGYHAQYKAMGWSNDWKKEIATHTPEYYKWTQWIFSQMYKHGLAYQDARMQWWCTKCQTVLANEQVIDGKCWRHDGLDDPIVEKKEVKQWFFKITEYADELLEAIDELDWTESVKLAQKNWIGKSVGAEINFTIASSTRSQSESPHPDEIITVFTTRADTLFGATFLVLAPEHDLVSKITIPEHHKAVDQYVQAASKKTEVERQAAKEKTGIFTGAYAYNPINNEKIPIWVADYVLAGYGTGAIMAVPAHDERDNEFAKKFGLPIIEVVAPDFGAPLPNAVDVTGPVVVGYDPATQEFMSLINTKNNMRWLASGGLNEGEEYEVAALRELSEEAGYKSAKKLIRLGGPTYSYYYNSNKDSNRRSLSYLYLAILDKSTQGKQALESHEQFEVRWSSLEEIVKDFEKEPEGRGHWIDGMERAKQAAAVFDRGEKYEGPIITGEGVLFNSGAYTGLTSSEARERIIADLRSVEFEPTFTNTPGSEDSVKEELPFVEREAITAIVKHWKEDKYLGLKWKTADWDTFLTGGVDTGQTAEEAAIREIQEETGYKNPKLVKSLGKNHAKLYHIPKKENRFAHFSCLYFELQDGEREAVSEEEQKSHDVVWLSPQEIENFRLPASHRFTWNKFMGKEPKAAAAREVTNYRMRDWSVSRQRYWGAPIPIINCEKCGTVLISDENLPVALPELTDFKPSGDGRSALARAKDWLSVDCPKCGSPAERETDTLDTYICSSWYMYRYMDPHNQEQIFDSELAKKWEPIDFYNGADHATAHLLYARFIARFFTKLGLVNEPEPFKQFLFNGKVVNTDGSFFSKSKGVVIDPREIIDQGYGADALRLYLMFAAPLEVWTRWDPQGVPGTFRFLTRLWNLVQEYSEANEGDLSAEEAKLLLATSHKMIKKVTEDIQGNRYNTAIAATMANLNDLYQQKAKKLIRCREWQQVLENITACVAPFAPHAADELWSQLGHSTSVHRDSWPTWDESLLVSDTIKIVVQVNGKVRATVEVSSDSTEAKIVEAAQTTEKVAALVGSTNIKKTIYVPQKLVNFVT